ncbi:hypothetical protein GUJ93_ZPchr0010g10417 [Zizania palustris]|uniref:Auxin responsive protein n=1 Tax=Zizania palustris TaxID=103762 RepID=A0A8J5WEE5_ZIZPA|nr:hypothetical protein GUJ93_ZPchr0010g10417 [Zizania palustris]
MRERLIPVAGEKAVMTRRCMALLLGVSGGGVERVVVEVRVLGQPRVHALMEKVAQEFRYDQKGVLRVPCSADEFWRATGDE